VGKPEKFKPLIETSWPWQLTLIVILIGSFMAILDSSIVNVAIPSMMNDFQATTSQIQWVVTIYMLALGVIVATSGWLGDFLGLKKLYIYSLIIFTLGSLLCSLSWNEKILSGARVIQAFGGGMIQPTTMAMVYSLVPRNKIGSAMGMFGLTMIVAPSIGPTLGGYLVQYISWRWIFTINVPIGIIGTFLAVAVLPEFPRHSAGKFDLTGAVTSAIGLFCLLFALSEGQDWGWGSLPIVLLLYFSFAFLGLFIFHELTTEEPLLDLRIFKYPTFTIGNIMLIIITVGMFGGLFYVPLYLQSIRGLGAFESGLVMLPPALVSAVMLPISGQIYDRVGPKPAVIGLILMAYGTFLLTRIDASTPIKSIIAWMTIRSLGMGLTMMPVQTALMSVIPTEKIGRASSITNIVSRVSGSFGIAMLTLLLTNRQAFHTASLTWQVPAQTFNTFVANNMLSSDSARILLQSAILRNSFVNAISDVFLVTAGITLLAVLPTFLLKKGTPESQGKMVME